MSYNDLIPVEQMTAQCFCLNTQRTARAVARLYDATMRPVGLTSGQFSILAALNQQKPVSIGALADGLGPERTTLTRNLAPLEAAGLIQSEADDGDRRVRRLSLTVLGRERLALAMPLWRRAQQEATAALAPHPWTTIQPALSRLGSI